MLQSEKRSLCRFYAAYQEPVLSIDELERNLLQLKDEDYIRLHKRHGNPPFVRSVHETEGCTFKEVWLFRLTKDKPMRKKTTPLWDKSQYVTVAVSRHTEKFVYHTVCDDTISRGIEALDFRPLDKQ